MPLIVPSIEFFEDVVYFLFFDPRALVRHTEGTEFVVFICRDPDGLTRGRDALIANFTASDNENPILECTAVTEIVHVRKKINENNTAITRPTRSWSFATSRVSPT